MRKDIKVGFAIGGVLLAVLVVYVLVISGADNKPAEVSLVTSTANGAQTSKPKDASEKPSDSNQPGAKVDGAGDPFKNSAQATSASESKPAGPDAWSSALTTGKVPVMLTQTPIAKSDAPAAEPTASNDNTPPLMASATPATQPESTPQASVITSKASATGSQKHTVQKGETFASIAGEVYGNPAYYSHLIRANPTIDPRKLKAGTVINVPPASEVKADGKSAATAAPAAEATSTANDSSTTYRVERGDTLTKISVKLYGRRDRADKIYELNKSTIGENPAAIKVGQSLQLPEAPSVAQR